MQGTGTASSEVNEGGRSRALGKTVAFVTMGCAKNEVDTEHMSRRLAQAGYAISDDPDCADAVIVNTCCFIEAATEESIEAILDVADMQSVSSGKAKLIVAGCMPARYGEDLAGELPEVASFVPCSREDAIVDEVDRLCGVERLPGEAYAVQIGPAAAEGKPSAYVKISDGCDRFCAYCAIPYIRGRYRSFPFEEIREEVAVNVAAGAREIVLIAQDTGRWGADFDEPSSLASLLARLADDFADVWFRVMYIQPEGVTDELLEVVASHDNVCSYLDIPFQHADAGVLKSMNRKGSAEEFIGLIDRIRARIPDVTLRTTLIAGYPGETEEAFRSLCDFVEDIDFDYVGVFAYSREEGTRAHDLPGQLDEDEKMERAQEIRDIADAVCAARVANRVGFETDVLVCGSEEDGQLFGRAMSQAPDVDGVTYVDGGEVGQVVRVRIEGTLLYEMEGTVIS